MGQTDEMFFKCVEDYVHVLMLLSPVTFIAFLYAWYKRRRLSVPPGPVPFPFLGNIPQLIGRDMKTVLETYRRRYGPIFTIHIFSKPIIICNDYEVISKMFNEYSDIFSCRPVMEIPSKIIPGKGIATASGDIWKKNRAFVLRVLKQFTTEQNGRLVVHNECKHIMEAVGRSKGEAFDICKLLKKAVINVIFSVVFGKRYDYSDTEFNDFIRTMDDLEQMKGSVKPMGLRYIPGDPFKIRTIIRNFEAVCTFYKARIDEHTRNFNEDRENDMIHEYIQETRNGTADMSEPYHMVRTMYDVIGATKATLTPPMKWGIAHLTRNPDVQEKIYEQITEKVSEDKLPDMTDITKMAYFRATIFEILRLGDSVPFTFPYTTDGFARFLGYKFPQNAVIFPFLRSVLRDGSIWGDADDFRPSRFLNEDNSELKVAKECIPFSIGPRRCPGEELAMQTLYLFFSGLLQQYKLLPGDNTMPSLEIKMNLFIEPKPFLVRAVRWNKTFIKPAEETEQTKL